MAAGPSREYLSGPGGNSMQPLTGLDASFLYAETHAAHMHTLKVLVLSLPPSARGGTPFERLRGVLRRRLPAIPQLRLRLAHNPLSIGHPVWLEGPAFDPADHLERLVLPEGSTLTALAPAVSRFAGEHLARDRPPWRVLVAEGLASDRVALVIKVHHALADGGAAMRLIERIFADLPPEEPAPRGEADPGAARLLALGMMERARELYDLPSTLLETARGVARRALRKRELRRRLPGPFDAPALSFNGRLTPAREIAFASLPLEDVRRVKRAFACTVNDVVLALVAGALRRYLAARGEPVDAPLVAAMPVGVRGEPYATGNRVSNLLVPIHVDREGGVERLRAAIDSARVAKELHALLGESLLRRWAELAQPTAMRWLWTGVVPHVHAPPINLVVSNVPGPRHALAADGAELVDLYSAGPLLERVGLNVTVWSYAERLNATVLSCPDHGTDPRAIAAGLGAGLEELLGEAGREARV